MKRKKNKMSTMAIYIIILLVLYVIIYVFPSLTGALVSSYTADYGQLQLVDETKGYLVKNERVYIAPSGGKTNYFISEGNLIRKGTGVMEVSGSSDAEMDSKYEKVLERLGNNFISSDSYTVSDEGVVCYYADGYESSLNPGNMDDKNYDFYSGLLSDSPVNLSVKSVAKGQPVFKIVDRANWYLVCFVDTDHMDRYTVGKTINVEFPDDTIEFYVHNVSKSGNKGRIILKANQFYSKFGQLRVVDARLISFDGKGLILNNDSITEKDGEQGVFVKGKTGDYRFVPIKVIKTDGENSLVYDDYYIDKKGRRVNTVKVYDIIKKNP